MRIFQKTKGCHLSQWNGSWMRLALVIVVSLEHIGVSHTSGPMSPAAWVYLQVEYCLNPNLLASIKDIIGRLCEARLYPRMHNCIILYLLIGDTVRASMLILEETVETAVRSKFCGYDLITSRKRSIASSF
jgi:hypothetical protein